MRVLIGCEESGVVRDAFARRGHDAWSCDILPRPGNHIRRDILHLLGDKYGCPNCEGDGGEMCRPWDMMIAFPPCTYLCSSGLHRNQGNPQRQAKTRAAIEFVLTLWNADIPRVAIENPIGKLSQFLGKPSQIIQPYEFGHDASKATCLWLRNLPALEPTKFVPPYCICVRKHRWRGGMTCPTCRGPAVTTRPRWANQTDSGQNKEPPGHMRARRRSVTYEGIAEAMAEQWGAMAPRLGATA